MAKRQLDHCKCSRGLSTHHEAITNRIQNCNSPAQVWVVQWTGKKVRRDRYLIILSFNDCCIVRLVQTDDDGWMFWNL